MAPDKVLEFWHARLREVAEEFPKEGAPRIQRRLEAIALEEGRDDCPSLRWVGTRLRAHRALPPEDRAQFSRFTWPASMEANLLPWEASRVALDVLRNTMMLGGRPTVEYVRWHWRIAQASPSTAFDQRDALVTGLLMARDGGSTDGTHFDAMLAFEPWLSDLHRSMYNRAFPDSQWEGETK